MLEKAGRVLRWFITDEQGLETVEYAVIGGLILVGVVATVIAVRDALKVRFQELQQAIQGSGGPP